MRVAKSEQFGRKDNEKTRSTTMFGQKYALNSFQNTFFRENLVGSRRIATFAHRNEIFDTLGVHRDAKTIQSQRLDWETHQLLSENRERFAVQWRAAPFTG